MSVLAYLDPGSAGLIAATVAGGAAGVGVAVKSMWRDKTKRFRKNNGGQAVNEPGDESSEPAATESAAHDDA